MILTRPNKIITRQQNGSPWRCRQVHNLWNSVHDKEESFNYCLLIYMRIPGYDSNQKSRHQITIIADSNEVKLNVTATLFSIVF